MPPTSKPSADAGRVDPAVWRLAFTIIVGALAPMFDTTIVSVAINDLARLLHAPLGTMQLYSTSERTRLDAVGLLLLSPGAAAIIYGLSRIDGASGFGSAKVLIPALAGLALVAAFVVRALPRGAAALVNVRLFGHRSVASSSVLYFLSGATLYGAMLLLPLYLQQVRSENALGAGLLLIPQGIGTLLSRFVA